ncbi:MAG: helix-turn-helix domain-containing protein [Candidatus Limisoma sp.]
MDLIQFTKQRQNCHELNNGFLIWQISADNISEPCYLDGNESIIVVHILVISGSLEISYRESTFLLKENEFGHFIHGTNIRISRDSEDVNAYFMLLADSYNKLIFTKRPPLPFSLVARALKHPVSTLPPTCFNALRFRFQCIISIAADYNHIFRNEMIKNAVLLYFMDMADLYIRYSGGETDNLSGRKIEIFLSFMKLLELHSRQHHSVGFYASELCISHQYLNRIVKKQTGKTAFDWICNSLIGEIVRMLEYTNDSMQQIANKLNFSDQATLSKFFKHHTGYSLTEYRKNLNS